MWLSVKAHWPFQCQPLAEESPLWEGTSGAERAGPRGESTALEAGILAQPLGAGRAV